MRINLLIDGYSKENCKKITPKVINDTIFKYYKCKEPIIFVKKEENIDLTEEYIILTCCIKPEEANYLLQITHYDIEYLIQNEERIVFKDLDIYSYSYLKKIFAEDFTTHPQKPQYNSVKFVAYHDKTKILESAYYNINGIRLEPDETIGVTAKLIALACNACLYKIRKNYPKQGIFSINNELWYDPNKVHFV